LKDVLKKKKVFFSNGNNFIDFLSIIKENQEDVQYYQKKLKRNTTITIF